MQHMSKRLTTGLVVVVVGCALAAAASLQRQTLPASAAVVQPSLTPIPGSAIPADPALLKAMATWLPLAATIPPSAATGGRDTALLDCHSGKVNLTVSHGWCYASPTRLFYNVQDGTFLDPLTGQLFTFYAAQTKLFTAARRDRVQLELEPPHLAEKHSASVPNQPVTGTCTNGQNAQGDNQQQAVNDHARNLGVNASRTDSPPMRQYFTEQATWWKTLCP